MTLDEAVAIFKRELPNWWWSVTECWVSCHGTCGPDWVPGYREHEDYGLDPIDVEIDKPSGPRGNGIGDDPTPAQILLVMVEKAKAAKATASVRRRARRIAP